MYTRRFEYREGPFVIVSYGNGAAYGVSDTRDGRSFFTQGEGADILREEMEAAHMRRDGIEGLLAEYLDAIGAIETETN